MRAPPANPWIVVASAWSLAACSQWPLVMGTPAHEHLDFLSHAMKATPAAREALWRENGVHGNTQETVLRRALLLSIPGSARYNPAKAENELRALLEPGVPIELASVARARLEAMQDEGECRDRVEVLKNRLSKIADIERGAESSSATNPENFE